MKFSRSGEPSGISPPVGITERILTVEAGAVIRRGQAVVALGNKVVPYRMNNGSVVGFAASDAAAFEMVDVQLAPGITVSVVDDVPPTEPPPPPNPRAAIERADRALFELGAVVAEKGNADAERAEEDAERAIAELEGELDE